jgi:hypothetical protein
MKRATGKPLQLIVACFEDCCGSQVNFSTSTSITNAEA